MLQIAGGAKNISLLNWPGDNTQPPSQWLLKALSLWIKQLGHEIGHSRPSST